MSPDHTLLLCWLVLEIVHRGDRSPLLTHCMGRILAGEPLSRVSMVAIERRRAMAEAVPVYAWARAR